MPARQIIRQHPWRVYIRCTRTRATTILSEGLCPCFAVMQRALASVPTLVLLNPPRGQVLRQLMCMRALRNTRFALYPATPWAINPQNRTSASLSPADKGAPPHPHTVPSRPPSPSLPKPARCAGHSSGAHRSDGRQRVAHIAGFDVFPERVLHLDSNRRLGLYPPRPNIHMAPKGSCISNPCRSRFFDLLSPL